MMKQRKWLIRCGQNGNESRKGVGHWPFVIKVLSALYGLLVLINAFLNRTIVAHLYTGSYWRATPAL